MSRSLMSSANLPKPRSRRSSSLRGTDLPTHLLPFPLTACSRSLGRELPEAHHSVFEPASCPTAPAIHRRPMSDVQTLVPLPATRPACLLHSPSNQILPPYKRCRLPRCPAPCTAPASDVGLLPGAASRPPLL